MNIFSYLKLPFRTNKEITDHIEGNKYIGHFIGYYLVLSLIISLLFVFFLKEINRILSSSSDLITTGIVSVADYFKTVGVLLLAIIILFFLTAGLINILSKIFKAHIRYSMTIKAISVLAVPIFLSALLGIFGNMIRGYSALLENIGIYIIVNILAYLILTMAFCFFAYAVYLFYSIFSLICKLPKTKILILLFLLASIYVIIFFGMSILSYVLNPTMPIQGQ